MSPTAEIEKSAPTVGLNGASFTMKVVIGKFARLMGNNYFHAPMIEGMNQSQPDLFTIEQKLERCTQ
jgi:hypothetical protein